MYMCVKFSFVLYVFINSFNWQKQSCFGWNLLHLSKKKIVYYSWKALNTKFEASWKDRESIYQVREILALFCILTTLVLGLRVTKIIKEIKFERVWGQLEAKKLFTERTIHNILRENLDFMWNCALREMFNFFFSAVFHKFLFFRKIEH